MPWLLDYVADRPKIIVEPPSEVLNDPRSGYRMTPAEVDSMLAEFGLDPSEAFAFHHRARRWEVWQPCGRLADHLRRDARIWETGCHVGSNLLWLAERGFANLYGTDIDERALRAGRAIAQRRPSEYRNRIAASEMEHLARGRGLRIVQTLSQPQTAPREVCVLEKSG